MKRSWKTGLTAAVVGFCCLATVADVDAGIVFRRRSRRSGPTYQAATTSALATAPATVATPAPPPGGPATGVAVTGSSTGATATNTTTSRTRSRRFLGRRRGTATQQVVVAPAAGTTVRGQNP